ncbi:hypothetical protein HPB52_007636 [Rhipicephalus sanguineus]|uniref:Uncharacterized protein n=1 Tax=Rhipicephalus sanguineus TaxID=34632 RepID=A0A9D4T1F0_RHISA|nr:hypothetical protein HPB52_007636 [Rhipicephalus sanguineus]
MIYFSYQGVDQWAERCKLMPLQVALQHLYPALKACSKRCSLGHLVDVLKEQGRLDVLNKISQQIKGISNPDNVRSSLNNDERIQEEESMCGSLIDKILPKTKLDKLTVLVSHLEEDIDLAQELAKTLETEYECYVLTQAEIQPALHTDPTLIEDLIQKVKAIVPLITRAYLDHYEHSRRTTDLNSADSVLTREVYSLSLHRLVSSSCLYYMLFPVRTPDVKYEEVRRHHIFSKSKVLCKKDLALLVKTMHACRKLRISNERGGS